MVFANSVCYGEFAPSATTGGVNARDPCSRYAGVATTRTGYRGDDIGTRFAHEFRDEVEADEAAIAAAYEELRDPWFLNPAQRQLDVYWPNPSAITAQVILAEGAVEAYYEANREQYLIPAGEVVTEAVAENGETPEPTYRGLEDVRSTIDFQLRRDIAEEFALQLAQQFNVTLGNVFNNEGKKPSDLDDAQFAELVASVTIVDEEFAADWLGFVIKRLTGSARAASSWTTKRHDSVPGLGPVRLGEELFDAEC